MKLRTKKMLSLLLASAMVFTMNTAVFAEEVNVDAAEEFVEVDSVDSVEEIPGIEAEVAATISPDAISANDVSGNSVSAQNLLLLSENGKRVKEELKEYAHEDIKGTNYSFTFRYTKAVGFGGRKLGWDGAKNNDGRFIPVKVQLFYCKGASANGAISDNSVSGDAVSADKVDLKPGWVDITDAIRSVNIKSSKGNGATVDITGAGIVAAKDCAYINDIKLDKKSSKLEGLDKKAINALQKELSNSLKATAKAIKKDKTSKISANGLPAGKTAETDRIKNLITVYPAYVYSYSDQSSLDIANAWGDAGLNYFFIGDPKKSDLDINSKKIIGLNKDKATKAYTSEVKSLKGYLIWAQGSKDKVKKITLKPDKITTKATTYNGLSTTEEKAKFVKGEAVKGADGKETGDYVVNASGNVFGAIAFNPKNVK